MIDKETGEALPTAKQWERKRRLAKAGAEGIQARGRTYYKTDSAMKT